MENSFDPSTLGIIRRPLKAFEYAPPDFFQRLSKADLPNSENAPLELDLGCGDGDFLVAMAQKYPEKNFLGVERLLGRIDKVGRKIQRAQLHNCHTLRLDIQYAVHWLLPHQSASRIHLLCPDPWPKKRHHKNRNFRPDFLQAIHSLLEENGEFFFMTDHEEYYHWALDILENNKAVLAPLFTRIPWQDGDLFYPKTGFQLQWEAQGKQMHRLRLQKQ